jgi:hypothetical protein
MHGDRQGLWSGREPAGYFGSCFSPAFALCQR